MTQIDTNWRGPATAAFVVWVGVCALAELVGISMGAVWWIAMDRIDPEPTGAVAKWTSLALKSLSGLGEGVLLGTLQYLALRRIYPVLSAWRWIVFTSLLAVAGWAVGSSIPLFVDFSTTADEPFDPPILLLAMAASVLGAALGAVFGLVQREALKLAAKNSQWWIIANALGWALALPIIYVAASLGEAEAPVSAFVTTGLMAGLAAGIVLGIVTGLSFWKMEPVA